VPSTARFSAEIRLHPPPDDVALSILAPTIPVPIKSLTSCTSAAWTEQSVPFFLVRQAVSPVQISSVNKHKTASDASIRPSSEAV